MSFALWLLIRFTFVVGVSFLLHYLIGLSVPAAVTVSFGAYCLYTLFFFEREMRVVFQNRTRMWFALMGGFGWGPGMAAVACAAASIYMFEILTESFVSNSDVKGASMFTGVLLSFYLAYRALNRVMRGFSWLSNLMGEIGSTKK